MAIVSPGRSGTSDRGSSLLSATNVPFPLARILNLGAAVTDDEPGVLPRRPLIVEPDMNLCSAPDQVFTPGNEWNPCQVVWSRDDELELRDDGLPWLVEIDRRRLGTSHAGDSMPAGDAGATGSERTVCPEASRVFLKSRCPGAALLDET